VGEGEPAYIVAEVSANHNQKYEHAVGIIEAAQRAGADAVKIQTYTPDTMTIDSDREWFQIPGDSVWAGKTLYQLYGEAYTPWDWQPKLKEIALSLGLDFFSSPFDATAVDFLEQLNVPVYKVASFEIVDVPLLRKVAKTRKPVILSTGMASLSEIDEAVRTLREAGSEQIALLKCTSAYPASPEEMNLRTIPNLRSTFNVVTGLSDHTLGSSVALAAVALGASIVEKHLTIARADGGPDSSFSMEPDEFAKMVQGIRQVEQALGSVSYARTAEESKSLCFRRSLFVVRDMKAGEQFTKENVRPIRPGHGLQPRYLDEILGKKAACDIQRGTPISWDLIGGTADR
jgi:pseudaminic acid synthase